MPQSMSGRWGTLFGEDQAGLDQRRRGRRSVSSCASASGVTGNVRLAVLVHAFAAGLGSELAVGDDSLHALVDVETLAVGVVQVLGDVVDGVQTEDVDG